MELSILSQVNEYTYAYFAVSYRLIQVQIEALQEWFKYVEDKNLPPLNQDDVKRRCLQEWDLPLEAPQV